MAYKTSTPSIIDKNINTWTYIKPLAKIGKSIANAIAQSGGSVGVTLMSPLTHKDVYTDEDFKNDPDLLAFKRLIFGNEPIKTIQQRIAESEIKLQSEGIKVFGKQLATPEQFSGKKALGLSAIGVIGNIGLDFTGAGGEKGVVKLLTKLDKVEEVANVLRKINVAEDLIPVYAKTFAKLNKADDVAKTLTHLTELQKTTKVISKIAPEAQKGVSEAIKVEKGILPKIIKQAPKERAFFQTVKDARPNIPLKIGGQYIPRSTDDLAIKARNLVKTDITTAENLARTGTDDKSVAVASELIKHYSDEAIKTTNQATKAVLYEKASEITHITAKNLTNQGRTIQAATIMGRLTPEGFVRFAAKEINRYNENINLIKRIPNLTAKQTEYILTEAGKITKMSDGMEKAMAFQKLNNYITALVPTPFFKKLVGVWKAGLLTGIKTSGLNTFSNLFHGASETVKDIPAAAVDSVASLFTGKRTLVATTKGLGQGTKQGFEKGWQYLKTGFDERNIGVKLDYTKINFGKGKVAQALQKYEEGVFRVMGAEDQPFYYGAKARSLYSQAIAQAKNTKLRGKEAQAFIENLVKSPTDEMVKYAVTDAEIAVFQNKTTLGEAAKKIQQIGGGFGEFVVPFGRTPSSVAMQLLNYSPVGIVKEIAYQIKAGKFDQRLFSQAVGRGITGTAVLYVGAELFKKGLINLSYPTTEKERKLWELEGRIPNSIKIGNDYRNVNTLGPLGMTLLVGGQYQKSLEETGSHTAALLSAASGGIKSLTEQTFLRGLNQVVDTLSDPSRSPELYASNLISSFIPTIMGDIARAKDVTERKVTGLWGKAISKIPILREKLQPQVDVLGQERKRPTGWLSSLIDPSRPSMVMSSPVTLELRRLWDAGHDVSPTQLGDKNGYKTLTQEQNTALWKRSGELLNNKLKGLIKFKAYEELSDDEKAKVIDSFVDKAFLTARANFVVEMTQGLSGEELKKELAKLKGNLLTKEVFREFLKIR